MISRVIEAKPEELRVFLEEAAGVSKYRERRRETELRLKDTRENLLRVDDIRQELDKQLEHLARAGRGREALSRAPGASSRRRRACSGSRAAQEAASARARHAREIERLGVELEAETAKLREAEKRLETLRDEHYRAGDAMHAAQGALYESNAEVARLEQQIAHVRENRARIEHQIANLRAQLAQRRSAARGGAGESRRAGSAQSAKAQRASRRRRGGARRRSARSCRSPKKRIARATAAATSSSARSRSAEQALHVERTKLEHAARVLDQLAQREERLREEQAALPVAGRSRARAAARGGAASSRKRCTRNARELADKEARSPSSSRRCATRSKRSMRANQRLTGLEARLHALTQLQDRIARGAELQGWLAARGLDSRAAPVAGHHDRAGLGRRARSGAARAPERHRARRHRARGRVAAPIRRRAR